MQHKEETDRWFPWYIFRTFFYILFPCCLCVQDDHKLLQISTSNSPSDQVRPRTLVVIVETVLSFSKNNWSRSLIQFIWNMTIFFFFDMTPSTFAKQIHKLSTCELLSTIESLLLSQLHLYYIFISFLHFILHLSDRITTGKETW